MRIVFMGSPGFAVPSLERLAHSRHRLVAVYTPPGRPAGRGRALAASAVKAAARRYDLTVVQPSGFRAKEAVAQLARFKPDVIVVAAYGQILPPSVLDIPRYGCLNIHPSLLPRHRGAAPVTAALLEGDEFTGVSIMLLDAGMDTGPVLARGVVPVSPRDNTGTLTARLSLVAAHLLEEALTGWGRGEIAPRPQDDAGATYSVPVTKEAGVIDWNLPALELWRRVRAYNPWPVCSTRWRGRQLRIFEAVPLPAGDGLDVGRVAALSGGGAVLGIGTGDGILGVLRLQIEGKRAMSAEEFLRGQRDFVGAVLPD